MRYILKSVRKPLSYVPKSSCPVQLLQREPLVMMAKRHVARIVDSIQGKILRKEVQPFRGRIGFTKIDLSSDESSSSKEEYRICAPDRNHLGSIISIRDMMKRVSRIFASWLRSDMLFYQKKLFLVHRIDGRVETCRTLQGGVDLLSRK